MSFVVTNPRRHRWILVSGAPRSGTSFVGNVLGHRRDANVIYEPFNPDSGLAWNDKRYLHVGPLQTLSPELRTRFEEFFDYQFTLKLVRSKKDHPLESLVKSIVGGGNQLTLLKGRLNPFARISIIKDPIAVFLAETFAELRDVRTVMMIRHPLSFIGSLKRLQWRFRLEPLLENRELCERYAPELLRPGFVCDDWVSASCWIWRVINSYVLDVSARQPAIMTCIHERISEDPLGEFHRLHEGLGLPWSKRQERLVRKYSRANQNGSAREGIVHDFRRDSSAIFRSSIGLLDEAEISRTLDICWPVAQRIYRDPMDSRSYAAALPALKDGSSDG